MRNPPTVKKEFSCHRHGEPPIPVEIGSIGCGACLSELSNRRPVSGMSVAERVTEMRSWGSVLTVPFTDLHGRFEELVGRSVWTHEFASPEALIFEVENQQPATFTDVLGKIPKGMPVIVVETPDCRIGQESGNP